MFWKKKEEEKNRKNEKWNLENLNNLEQEIENLENSEVEQEINDFENKKENCEEKINELNDKYLRLAAEFENYKKRTTDEKIQNFNIGWKQVLSSILPFLDNFKRAFDSCDDELKKNEWVKWILSVEQNLVWDLEKIWFKKIKAEWEKFDFKKHEALMQNPEVEKDVIAQVLEEWYEYNWQVVRHVKVSVWSK